MTAEELRQYDGREGRKAYVAVNGKIYDVSASPLWSAGDHQGEHQAGADLSEALKQAPHVRSVMERFPVVAELEVPTQPPAGGKGLVWIALAVAAALVAVLVLLI